MSSMRSRHSGLTGSCRTAPETDRRIHFKAPMVHQSPGSGRFEAPSATTCSLFTAKVEVLETVWKIARGLSSVHVDGTQGGEMAPLAPSRPLVGAQSGAYPDFPDNLSRPL